MSQIIVFCGHVGSGKSVMIAEYLKQNSGYLYLDIFDYVKKYKDETGHVERADTYRAHEEFYRDVGNLGGGAILEIGTNWAEFHFTNLSKLQNKNVKVIFCLLPNEICIQRVMERAKESSERLIGPEDLRQKFERPFPQEQKELAVKFNIPFIELDMLLPIPARLKILEQFIKKSLT